jgi:hypothetical protein
LIFAASKFTFTAFARIARPRKTTSWTALAESYPPKKLGRCERNMRLEINVRASPS